jgi:hypothetical protein
LSSLSLAVKLCEDADSRLLARLRPFAYSNRELRRMELAILSRLDWDLGLPSLFRFLQAMLSLCGPLLTGVQVATVHEGVLRVLCNSALIMRFRPSLLALALLSLLLEDECEYWLSIAIGLQTLFQVSPAELIEAREAMHMELNEEEDDAEKENTVMPRKGFYSSQAPSKSAESGVEWGDALHVLYTAQPD